MRPPDIRRPGSTWVSRNARHEVEYYVADSLLDHKQVKQGGRQKKSWNKSANDDKLCKLLVDDEARSKSSA